MTALEFVSVYRYRDEVVAEACVSGDAVDLEVHSYEFEPLSGSLLAPKGEFDTVWREEIVRELEANGYSLGDPVTTDGSAPGRD